ncbi:MAG: GNAT family N-acetyltransferase [Gammaproteobacteria bacterium]|nr:GNAT family N-acetyltransferase [Gammaproteobacteria bacterium]
MYELDTERLRLTPFTMDHLDALHALWTDPDVRRYLWDGEVISRERAAEVIADSERNFAQRGFGFYAMLLGSDDSTDVAVRENEVVGFCGYRVFEDSGEPELLYGILPRYWGKGLVTEAGHAVIRDGFERNGFSRIIAATDTPNQSSVKVMQRLGMVFLKRGKFHGLDTVFFELTPDDYAAHQALGARHS